jgi:hypothetical protein
MTDVTSASRTRIRSASSSPAPDQARRQRQRVIAPPAEHAQLQEGLKRAGFQDFPYGAVHPGLTCHALRFTAWFIRCTSAAGLAGPGAHVISKRPATLACYAPCSARLRAILKEDLEAGTPLSFERHVLLLYRARPQVLSDVRIKFNQ